MWNDTNESATVVAAFIGLAGALAGAAVSWFNTTSSTAQRHRVYEEASGRVTFWAGWLKARLFVGASAEETASLRAKVRLELRVAEEYVESVIRGERARAAYHNKRRKLLNLRRWFLLYQPPRGRAWITRVIFLLLVIAAPLYFAFYGAAASLLSRWSPVKPLSPYLISPILIVFAWLFRGTSIFLEKPDWNDRAGRYLQVDKLRAEHAGRIAELVE